MAAWRAASGRAIGLSMKGPVSPVKGAKRFTDLAHSENPWYFLLQPCSTAGTAPFLGEVTLHCPGCATDDFV